MTILNPTNQKATLVKTDDDKRIIVGELMVDSKPSKEIYTIRMMQISSFPC